jgi:uncharacterized protein YbaP (TraB family)
MALMKLSTAMLFALGLLTSLSAEAQTAIDEVEVSGERPGPGLWTVRRGDHTLYLLGTLTPLPGKMIWRSREVERVLANAQLFIPERPSVDVKAGPIVAIKLYMQWRRSRENPGGAKLAQVLPPELYARFETLRLKYAPHDSDLEQRRPLLAAAMLYDKAVETAGLKLDGDVAKAVRKLAIKQRVPVADIEQKLDDPRGALADLDKISPAAEQACLAATVSRLETDLDAMRVRAQAWAVGDVAALRTQPGVDQETACWGAINSAPRLAVLRAQFDSLWLNAAVQSLEANKITLAVIPISRLLERGGVLENLQTRGYGVTAP